ncbi:MAG: Uma2 family endonuclease [Leptolyngbyaceae cyanobacterium]
MYPTPKERFEDFVNHHPENKLELINGQLIVGNSLVGSRLLLRQILQGWGAEAAIALAPVETWLAALAAGYEWSLLAGGSIDERLTALEAQARDCEFTPADLAAGSVDATWLHHHMRQNLTMGLFGLANQVGGQSLGRDFVMRLGHNGFTPDLVFFKNAGLNRLYSRFVRGPAELVIEVLLPGHEACDRVQKYAYYQAAGVPEYWLIDPAAERVEFYRHIEDGYQPQPLAGDGFYRPSSVPGLAFCPAALWQAEDRNPIDPAFWVVEQPVENWERSSSEEGPRWGSLLFIPNIQVQAVPISFEEFISWAPRAKFEFIQGKPLIDSTPGTRNVLAMLLMTFGLASVVTLLPPQAWLQGLRQRLEWESQDAERKAEWWAIARKAAEKLRTDFAVGRLGVIGDLAMPQPLNYWSGITLVYWEKLENSWQVYDALEELDPDRRIVDWFQVDKRWLTADQRWQIEQHLVEL